jgi:hypothetical protein
MKNKEKNESLQWLKALMGNPDPKADKNLNIEAKVFRQGMLKDKKSEHESIPIADERLYQVIKSNLQNQGFLSKPKKSFIKSYIESKKEAFKFFITALVALLVGAMIPMQIATRGESYSIFSKFSNIFQTKSENIKSEITLINKDPIKYSQDLILIALSAKLEVKVFMNNEDGIALIIYGLNENDKNQSTLKAFIGLSNQTNGNIKVIIKKK